MYMYLNSRQKIYRFILAVKSAVIYVLPTVIHMNTQANAYMCPIYSISSVFACINALKSTKQ